MNWRIIIIIILKRVSLNPRSKVNNGARYLLNNIMRDESCECRRRRSRCVFDSLE